MPTNLGHQVGKFNSRINLFAIELDTLQKMHVELLFQGNISFNLTHLAKIFHS
jgi:hypothetical protein